MRTHSGTGRSATDTPQPHRQVRLTQEVMGSEGSASGGGGGAYRLVRSRSLNFFPIRDRALSTCCCVPAETPEGEGGDAAGGVQGARDVRLTLYVTDLEVLCVRQGGDVDLCPRVLLQVAHVPALLAYQPPHQGLQGQSARALARPSGSAPRSRPPTHLGHLDLPHDELGAGGRRVLAGTLRGAHGAAAVHRVHAVHVGAWAHIDDIIISSPSAGTRKRQPSHLLIGPFPPRSPRRRCADSVR